jgi:hypothetical protein
MDRSMLLVSSLFHRLYKMQSHADLFHVKPMHLPLRYEQPLSSGYGGEVIVRNSVFLREHML